MAKQKYTVVIEYDDSLEKESVQQALRRSISDDIEVSSVSTEGEITESPVLKDVNKDKKKIPEDVPAWARERIINSLENTRDSLVYLSQEHKKWYETYQKEIEEKLADKYEFETDFREHLSNIGSDYDPDDEHSEDECDCKDELVPLARKCRIEGCNKEYKDNVAFSGEKFCSMECMGNFMRRRV